MSKQKETPATLNVTHIVTKGGKVFANCVGGYDDETVKQMKKAGYRVKSVQEEGAEEPCRK